MKAKKTLFCFLLFLILFLLSCIYYEQKEYKTLETTINYVEKEEALTFSLESGIYHDDIEIELGVSNQFNSDVVIYYTLDGNDPTEESEEYKDPIELEMDKEATFIPIKAILSDGKSTSEIYEATYILTKDDFDLPIVTISIDEYSLYDEDYGIFANYTKDSEEWHRDSHVVMFDMDGSIILDQDIQLGVGGGTSTAYSIKSLKMYTSEEIDEDHPKFILDSFTADKEESSTSFVYEFNSLKLRAGSQDMTYGNIRSSIVSRLASESNFEGYMNTSRCLVVLNNKIYGVFDMQENYSNSFLKKRYGLDGEDVIIRYKGYEEGCLTNAGVYQYFMNDLNDEANRKLLETYVDMDSYLLYYGLNVAWDNTDWPGNNFSCFKYTGEVKDNPYSDGRIRFLIYDTDLIYYIDKNHEFFEGALNDTFQSLMEKKYRATKQTTFTHVMDSEYYRDRFITLLCDLFNTTFEEDHVLEMIDEEYSKVDSTMKDLDFSEYKQADYYIDVLKQAVSKRKDDITADLKKYFNCITTYDFNLSVGEGIVVTWNNMEIYANESYSNEYYTNISLELKANVYDGYTFDYFEVNGKKYNEEVITITTEMIQNGKVSVKVHASRISEPCLIITEISAKDDQDFYKLANVGGSSINLKNYYITDTLTDLVRYQLPDLELKTDESVIINGKKNYYAIGNYICNFNLSGEETIYITDGKHILDHIEVVNMTKYETYGRYNNSPIYKFFNNRGNQRRISTY